MNSDYEDLERWYQELEKERKDLQEQLNQRSERRQELLTRKDIIEKVRRKEELKVNGTSLDGLDAELDNLNKKLDDIETGSQYRVAGSRVEMLDLILMEIARKIQ